MKLGSKVFKFRFQFDCRADAPVARRRYLRRRRSPGQARRLHQRPGPVAVARRQGKLAHLRVQRLQVQTHHFVCRLVHCHFDQLFRWKCKTVNSLQERTAK